MEQARSAGEVRQPGAHGRAGRRHRRLVQSFRRGPYVFDSAIHVIPTAGAGMVLDVTLRRLGVRDRVEFLSAHRLWDSALPQLFLRHGGEDAAFSQDLVSTIEQAMPSLRELHAHDLVPPPR